MSAPPTIRLHLLVARAAPRTPIIRRGPCGRHRPGCAIVALAGQGHRRIGRAPGSFAGPRTPSMVKRIHDLPGMPFSKVTTDGDV